MAVDWQALSAYAGAPTQTVPVGTVGAPTVAATPTSPYGVATPGTAPPPPGTSTAPQLARTGEPEWRRDLARAGSNINRVVAPRLVNFTARIRALPHPGGIALLVVVLLFLLVAVIPMNATDTRLSLFWKVLTGNYRVFADPSSGQPTDVAGGSIGPPPGSGSGFSVGTPQAAEVVNPVVTSPGTFNRNTLPVAIPVAGGYFEIPQVG